MLIKEFIQLKRDRVSFAMIVMIPLIQLLLFGYAINTTPRDLPTAVLLQENSDVGRSILAALKNTSYFKVTELPRSEAELDRLLASGKVLFAVEIPANFERSLRRGEKPAMLISADATDPVASGSAMSALGQVVRTALVHDRAIPDAGSPAFEIRTHARYNPAGKTEFNIVPGLVGTILTMTMLIFTALSVTREIERGTMENLLSMPITPIEIMLGKIIPYVAVGFLQAVLIIGIGILLFGVPMLGSRLDAGGALARCSSPPICRSATPSRPSRRTSCRRCRCRSCISCRIFCCPASCFRSPACRSGRNGSARRCRSRITCASCARSC